MMGWFVVWSAPCWTPAAKLGRSAWGPIAAESAEDAKAWFAENARPPGLEGEAAVIHGAFCSATFWAAELSSRIGGP